MSTLDPLGRHSKPLAAVLIAVVISLFIAAFIGGSTPFEYTGRALTYLGLLLYVIVGAFFIFPLVAESEQSLAPQRIFKWTLSLWFWPLLALRRRG